MGDEVQNLTGGLPLNRPEGDMFQRENFPAPSAETGGSVSPFESRPFGYQERTLFSSGDMLKTELNARADKLSIPRMDAVSETRLAKVNPQLADRIRLMAADLKRQGIDVVAAPKGDLRTVEQQNELYKIGRRGIEGEKPVTWVKGGGSYHNYGLAVDVVPKNANGEPTWDASRKTLDAIGQAGERQGLEWGGRWTKSQDDSHFQMTGGAKSASEWKATFDKGGLQAVWNSVNAHSKPIDGGSAVPTAPSNGTNSPAKNVAVPTDTLKRHSNGEQVRQLQDALFALGYKQLDPAKIGRGHGNFGPITDASLRDFQKTHNLVADGIYGPKTQAALREALAKTGNATGQSGTSTNIDPGFSRGQTPTNTDPGFSRTPVSTTVDPKFSPKLTPPTNGKSNGLPTTTDEANKFFKTQFQHPVWNPRGPGASMDCGPASLEAALEAVGVHKASHSKDTIDEARHLMHAGNNHGRGTGYDQIRDGAKNAGANVRVVSQNGWKELDNALASGKAVVINGTHKDIYRGAFGKTYHSNESEGGHFIAVVGRTGDGKYIVADSMSDGGTRALTQPQLQNFFYPKGGEHHASRLIIIGNPKGNGGNQTTSTKPTTKPDSTAQTSSPTTQQATTGGISARQIANANRILGGGLAGKGETILRLAKKYNVPAEFAIAMFRKEASFAQPGTLAARNNNPGNIKFAHQTGAVKGASGFAKWQTMDAGIEGFFKQMDRQPYRGFVDNKDYKSVIFRYAPPSENKSALYVREVEQWINEYRSQIRAD